jgi:hypothetical protein
MNRVGLQLGLQDLAEICRIMDLTMLKAGAKAGQQRLVRGEQILDLPGAGLRKDRLKRYRRVIDNCLAGLASLSDRKKGKQAGLETLEKGLHEPNGKCEPGWRTNPGGAGP